MNKQIHSITFPNKQIQSIVFLICTQSTEPSMKVTEHVQLTMKYWLLIDSNTQSTEPWTEHESDRTPYAYCLNLI